MNPLRTAALRRPLAAVLVALLGTALFPWAALAQSGAASGTAAQIEVAPGTDAASSVTVGESTGAVNSGGGIVADSPSSPQDESNDTAVGTATPVRAEGPAGIGESPGSVQSSAPGDAGGSDSIADADVGGSSVEAGSSETRSSANDDGSNPSTESSTEVVGASIMDRIASIGAATSRAEVEEAVDGTVTAIGEAAITEPSSLLGGLVTVAAIMASSRSVADGTSSDNMLDFLLSGLVLRATPDGDPLISFDAGPSADPDLVEVTATVGGLTETFTLPRGVNLLDPDSYDGTSLAFATALAPVLEALTGSGGPLEGSELILAGGFSEGGDGTFARGLIEVLRLSGALGGETTGSIVLGRAFSAADAERAFSTATDPELPPGETPTADRGEAFPSVRTATPAETIFTSPVSGGSEEPGPGTGGGDPTSGGDSDDVGPRASGGPSLLLAAASPANAGDRSDDRGPGSGSGDRGGPTEVVSLARTGSELVPLLAIAVAAALIGAVGRRRIAPRG